MKQEGSIRRRFKRIMELYNMMDRPLFELKNKYILHIDELSNEYQHNDDGSLNNTCVEECLKKSMEIYEFLNFSNDILVVYDNSYGTEDFNEINFLENTLINIKEYDKYKFQWKRKENKEILLMHKDDDSYTCIRNLYLVEDVKIEDLFKEIILSDIGGELILYSSIHIIDLKDGRIFHLYDDRGIYIYALNEEKLMGVWKKFHINTFTLKEQRFKIDIEKLYWIDGAEDEPNDICLHGDISIIIGEEKIDCSCTVSATALRMLKTLTQDHIPSKGEQILPCCGSVIIFNDRLDEVEIIGCDNGIDWMALHEEGMVKIVLDEQTTTYIYYIQYKQEVLNFVNQIENYYKQSSPKNFSNDFEKNGYTAFWNEWNRRKLMK